MEEEREGGIEWRRSERKEGRGEGEPEKKSRSDAKRWMKERSWKGKEGIGVVGDGEGRRLEKVREWERHGEEEVKE